MDWIPAFAGMTLWQGGRSGIWMIGRSDDEAAGYPSDEAEALASIGVIPAEAGIHAFRGPSVCKWVPAFAGMTL